MNYFLFIWHGFGWLVLVIVGLCTLAVEAILRARGVEISNNDNFSFAIALICSAIPCWVLGRYFLRYHVTIKDEETGEKLRAPQPYHALFWIPMHWWAPIFLVAGVWILIANPRKESLAPSSISPIAAKYNLPESASTSPSHRVVGGVTKYSILVSPEWTLTRNHNNFDLELSSRDSNYMLCVYALSGTQGNTDQWVENLLKKFKGNPANSLSRSRSITIDSHEWGILDGHLMSEGQAIGCRWYVYAGDGVAYEIMALSPTNAPSTDVSLLYEMAQSFRFPVQTQSPPTAAAKWITHDLDEISIDAPFAFQRSPEMLTGQAPQIADLLSRYDVYEGHSTSGSYYTTVSRLSYKTDIRLSLDGAVEGAVKGATNGALVATAPDYTSVHTHIGGLDARRATWHKTESGVEFTLDGLFVMKDHTLWSIQIAADSTVPRADIERILKSVHFLHSPRQ